MKLSMVDGIRIELITVPSPAACRKIRKAFDISKHKHSSLTFLHLGPLTKIDRCYFQPDTN